MTFNPRLLRPHWASAPVIGAVAALAGIIAALPAQARQCPELVVSAGNSFLNFEPLVGTDARGRKVVCAKLKPAQYAPRAIGISTPSGVKLGIGKGGQIYSIRVPGIGQNVLPNQREDAFFMDEIFQTAAANLAIKRQSPRSIARTPQARRGPSWHYHQAGAYQRGALRGLPPKFSPLVFNRASEAGGSYESLNIALQAHARHPTYTPDRFLVYSRVRHVGDDAFEVVQAWINNSYVADPVKRRPRTSLDHFNFPWLITRQRATPFVIANLRGELWDLSDKRWPPKRGDVLREGQWFGGFAGPDAGAPGYIVTLANDRRTRLRLGATDKRVVTNVTNDRKRFQFERQRVFVFGAIRTDVQATPGDIVVAKYYLLFGPRNRIEPKADRFFKSSYVKRLRLPARMAKRDLIGFCRASSGAFVDCPESKRPSFWLTRTICSECVPLYELKDIRTGRLVYSSDPYLGYKAGTPLTKLRYAPRRILGWLPKQNAKAPRGFRLVSVVTRDPLGIRVHPKDKGSAYLRRSN